MKKILVNSTSTGSENFSRERVIGIAAVAVIHVAFLYAFITGMAQHFVKEIPHLLEVQFVPQTEHVEPPPPLPELPNVEIAAVPQVAAPVIRIQRPQTVHTITAVRAPVHIVVPGQQSAAAAPPVAMSPAAIPPAPASAVGVAGTHTVPPYPPVARRLSQEGTVRLRIALDDRGAISTVTIAKSSGHETLDTAALQWVKSHWRYRPATRDGQPVASSTVADIVFDLRKS